MDPYNSKNINHISAKYKNALKRNLMELKQAILKRRALIGMHGANSEHSLDFFQIAAVALYNDTISHTIKVFEVGPKSASFWYIVRLNRKLAEESAKQHSISLKEMESLSKGFKHIRDKTHFHIDRHFAMDPKKVWQAAGISGNDLGYMLESAYTILCTINEKITGERTELPDYDGSDAAEIIRSYKKCHPEVLIVI